RDVTERKQAELALRESQDLLAYALALGKIGGWAINLDTREIKWTDEMFRVLGHSGEGVPTVDEGAVFFAPEDRALFTEAMSRAEQGEPLDVELRLAQRGTSQRWVRIMGKLQDREGPRMLGGLVQDITDSKNLELLRDDIDNIIRHDLKTPLNGIISLPQIILAGSNLSPDQIECLGYIEMSGKKMLRQVDMALDIMKIERGHFLYQAYSLDLLELCRVIIHDMEESIQRKKLSVEVLLQGEPLTESGRFDVSAEERLCFPMLANLIANAIEASPMGERVTINLTEGAEHVVSIRNLGPVPPDIRERFFEKFVTSGKSKGTGLGTYSAWLFAKAQGGAVELDASEDGATTVVVRLPKPSARSASV
ncbi:MAG: ATP-binding protein, partial [Humidesulfovibrio sp.]|nr:ATP-binding protein [Humidesulfovibrio sp.]